jgi:Bucentaur or craniofacial development
MRSITRQVAKGSEDEKKLRSGSKAEQVLALLKGRKKISTVEKSRLDWDRSKEAHGDAHELQQYTKSKDSYVSQTNFLAKVDLRTFERERAERAARRPPPRLGPQ